MGGNCLVGGIAKTRVIKKPNKLGKHDSCTEHCTLNIGYIGRGGGGTNPFSSSFNHSPSTFLRDILAHLDIMHMIVQGAIFIA